MKKQRSSFTGQVGFVLAAAGSAVGLGNIWRFPWRGLGRAGGPGGSAPWRRPHRAKTAQPDRKSSSCAHWRSVSSRVPPFSMIQRQRTR